ncbi:nickel-dependent hydrogenase large subunit [candidate division KSB1 bacterium]
MKNVIPIGPFHPLQEEPENFLLTVDGETVVDIEVNIGYVHKGHEILCQNKTWDQIPFVVERICGICSVTHTVCYCHAVEDLANVEIPPRGQYIRTIIGELERVHSHLLWAGLAGHFIGYNTVFMWAWKYREPVLDVIEKLTGGRNNTSALRIGGVRRDLPEEYFEETLEVMDLVIEKTDMLLHAVVDDPVIHARLKGVGILTKEDARRYCVVGPTARASGVDTDIRRDEPYGCYDKVDWKVILQEDGDVFAKAAVRLLELIESAKIIKQAINDIPGGPWFVDVGDIPPGEGVGKYEAPRGEDIHYVRSDGSNMPVRHKIRAPSYVNIPSFKASCIGESISDVTITLAAVDPCYSCTERMIRVKNKKDDNILTYTDLVRLSQEKTKKVAKKIGERSDLIIKI